MTRHVWPTIIEGAATIGLQLRDAIVYEDCILARDREGFVWQWCVNRWSRNQVRRGHLRAPSIVPLPKTFIGARQSADRVRIDGMNCRRGRAAKRHVCAVSFKVIHPDDEIYYPDNMGNTSKRKLRWLASEIERRERMIRKLEEPTS